MMYVISKDGSGDFTSIQAAIDAVPVGNRSPVILLVRMDTWNERIVVNKDNLRIIGEARDRTVITGKGCARDIGPDGKEKGTFLSATMLVTGANVEVENLTIRNDAGDGSVVGQAVAVYAAGDRGVWRNCRMIAAQDTLFCGPTMPKVARDVLPRLIPEGVLSVGDCPLVLGRQYFEDCYIQGDIDFIFGPYRCWFERCTLHMNKRGGWYTAANTPESAAYGMVFHSCRLTGDCEEGAAYLGRPWRPYARTVFLHCDMDKCVSPQGFADWQGGAPVTDRCGEYATTGDRADQSTRHPKQKRLTEAEASLLTIRTVLGGFDQWEPDRRMPTVYVCGDETASAWCNVLETLAYDMLVQNLTRAGASSKSYVAAKRLNYAELCLRPGDTLLVCFGKHDHSDAVEISTDARTTYQGYLNMYIDAARRQGAEAVLVAPAEVENYAASMRDLAMWRGVPCLTPENNGAALEDALHVARQVLLQL